MAKSNPAMHLLWIIPMGCLGVVVLSCGGCMLAGWFAVSSVVQGTQVYKDAKKKVESHPAVVAALGEPVNIGALGQLKVNMKNNTGSASFNLPISGPKGSGRVDAKANLANGQWTFTKLEVNVGNEKIDVLKEPFAGDNIQVDPDRKPGAGEAKPGDKQLEEKKPEEKQPEEKKPEEKKPEEKKPEEKKPEEKKPDERKEPVPGK